MALSVMRDAPVLVKVANPSSQDRTPRGAIVLAVSPAAAVGLAGSIFNCIGNIAGIVTPILFGYIVAMTGGNSWILDHGRRGT
jgi:hypothetical protein